MIQDQEIDPERVAQAISEFDLWQRRDLKIPIDPDWKISPQVSQVQNCGKSGCVH